MLNEQIRLNRIAEQEIYFCYWKDNSHCINEVNDDYLFELADKVTKSCIDGELINIHRKIWYTESTDLEKCLLDAVNSNRKYALVIKPANRINLSVCFQLMKLAEDNPNAFIFAHLVDNEAPIRSVNMEKINRRKYWYGIHPQLFLINLSMWKNIGSPFHTGYKLTDNILYDANRSKANLHDDYTPTWLKPNKKTLKYSIGTKMSWGWNILNKAFKYGYDAVAFTQGIRDEKHFYYLEEVQDNPNAINNMEMYIKDQELLQSLGYTNKIYMFNTEPYPTEFPNFFPRMKQVDAPNKFDNYVFLTSGFLGNFMLDTFKYSGKENIIFYDISGPAVAFKQLINQTWDPVEIPIRSIINEAIGNTSLIRFADDLDDLEIRWDEELKKWGGIDNFYKHWNLFQNNLHKVSYWQWDIVNNFDSWHVDYINNLPGKTFFWVSNVYGNEFVLNQQGNHNNIALKFKSLINNLNHNVYVYGGLMDLKKIDVSIPKNINLVKSYNRKVFKGSKGIRFDPVTGKEKKLFLHENINTPTTNWCILPWIHLTSSVAGWYRPCCDSNKNIKDRTNSKNDKEILHTSVMGIEDAFYGQAMNEIRSQFLKNERPKICSSCWKKEDANMSSLRIAMNSRFSNVIENIDVDKPKLKYLDIKYDNNCNLACRMCSTGSSDQHQKEILSYVKDGQQIPNHFSYASPELLNKETYKKQYTKRLIKLNEKPFLEQDVINSIPELMVLKATGGEPTINKKFLNAIDYAIEHDYAKNIELDLTTNGTKFTNEFLEKISQFKQLRLRISVDGTKDVYEYIRYPFQWDLLTKSVENLFKFCSNKKLFTAPADDVPPKAWIGFSIVVQPYNIFNLGEIYKWADNLYEKYKGGICEELTDVCIDFQMIPEQSELNPVFLPKTMLKKAYKKFVKDVTGIPGIAPRIEYFENFIKNLPNDDISIKDSKHNELKKFTEFFDKNRKQDYHDHLDPEMVAYLDNAPVAPWEKENNGFCILPWIHLSTRTTGNMQLCCTANSGSDDKYPMVGCNRKDDGELVNLKYDNWKENWNTKYMRDVRLAMLNGQKPRECQKCYKEEEVGYNSKRNWENKKWSSKLNYDSIVWHTEPDGSAPANIHYVDLKLGNKCNLACATCNPDDSSYWAKDWKKITRSNISSELKENLSWSKGRDQRGGYDWYKNKITWDELSKQKLISDAYILGGEPTIINEFKYFISKAHKQTNLRFNTNAQVCDDELLDLLEELKSVEVAISIDGIDSKHNWLRYPSDIESTLENLKKYNNFAKENQNIKLNIDTTASIFNIIHIPELIKWKLSKHELSEINKWPQHGGMIGVHFLYSPKFLSVKCLPKELKEKASDIYTDFYKWLEQNFEYYTEALEKPNGIKKLQSMIDFMWTEDLSHLLPQTIEYIKKLEEVRQLDFCKIFPELTDLYNNYGK